MKALILAAGYGTRLYPLTKEYPKPLLEVKKRPIIDYILEKLKKIQVNEIYVVTNSKFIGIFRQWARSKDCGKIKLVDDLTKSNQDRLGAIGDINFVIKKERIKEDILVIGGDNLFNGSLKNFLTFAARHKGSASIGLFKLGQKKDASRYGVVKLDKKKRVVDFQEKPENPESDIVAMCLYYIPQAYFKLINQFVSGKSKMDATGSYIAWLKNQTDVFGYVFKGSWFDIGDHKYLKAAKNNFAQ